MPKAKKQLKQKAPKTIAGTRSLSSFVKSICDIMRRSNCASALQYVPERTMKGFVGAAIFISGVIHFP